MGGNRPLGSVYLEWQTMETYTRKTTLPGGRVFDISVSSATGDVAVATSGGIAIYSPLTDSWKDVTRADGLPEDQVSALAFDRSGDLWVGFLTAGMARMTLKDEYKTCEFFSQNGIRMMHASFRNLRFFSVQGCRQICAIPWLPMVIPYLWAQRQDWE